MQFSRIKLENWRNFGKVDVPVSTRVFLVGANASGKSNFLDALRFLHELVISGGDFEKAISDRGGVPSIRSLAARQDSNIAIEVDIGTDECRLWRYRIVFNQEDRSPPILCEEKIWNQADELILDRPNRTDKKDVARLGRTHLEHVSTNQGFREIASFFESIHFIHTVPQLVREPERTAAGYQNDPYGSDFLEQIAKSHASTRKARLERIQKALRSVVPQLSEVTLWQDKVGKPHLRAKYRHWRPKGKWQTEREFSDGTLRLIGLLWALQDGEGPFLLEEPEISLHHGVVQLLPQLMYAIQRSHQGKPLRQTFISTHSAELLEDEGIGAHETLLMRPSEQGTEVLLCAENEIIMRELEAGLSIADVALVRTQPADLYKIALL